MESMTIVVMCCQWVSCTIEHLYKQTAAQLCNLACVRLYCIGCTSATCCCCCGGRLLLLLLSLFWPLSSFSCLPLFLLVHPPLLLPPLTHLCPYSADPVPAWASSPTDHFIKKNHSKTILQQNSHQLCIYICCSYSTFSITLFY